MHDDIHDEDLHAMVRQISNTVNRLDRFLTGGSDPKEGLLLRVDRIEQDAERNKETARNAKGLAWGAVGTTVSLVIGWFFTKGHG